MGNSERPQKELDNTELTIISSESKRKLRLNDGGESSSKKSGMSDATIVLMCTAVVAAIVGYTSFSDSKRSQK